ncbi:MAG: hypothetical protein ACLQUW_13235 [Desulfobaccales bacterium]
MAFKIFKTLVSIEGGGGSIFQMDTIEYEGKKWLVPKWLEAPTEGWKRPERIICLDTLAHSKAPSGFEADFVLNHPIPTVVLSGGIPIRSISVIRVIEHPDIKFPIPKGIH